MKRGCLFVFLLVIFLLIIFILWVYFSQNKKTGFIAESSKTTTIMANFFEAKTLHLKVKRQLTSTEGKAYPPNEIEIWIKDGKIREDNYQNGQILYTYISIDDKKVMSYNYKKHTKTPSPADTQYYLAGFQKPSESAKLLGEDKDNNCQIYDYPVDKTYHAEGSTYSYYLKNKTYCINNNQIVYFKNYGDSGEDFYKIELIEINPTIDFSVFKEPF